MRSSGCPAIHLRHCDLFHFSLIFPLHSRQNLVSVIVTAVEVEFSHFLIVEKSFQKAVVIIVEQFAKEPLIKV